MINEFLINALLVGGLLSIVLALLGIIVVLKKMSFIGAGLSHAAFAGVIMSLIAKINILIGGLIYNIIAVLSIVKLKKAANADALIGIIFSFSMALGVMLVYMVGINTSIAQILFGDILSITKTDVIIAFISSLVILAFLVIKRKQLVYYVFDEEFLKIKGINTDFIYAFILIMLALAITISIKLLGILIVSSFLIIPPTAAILISKSIKETVIYSLFISLLSLVAGLLSSIYFDVPASSVIVLISSLIFIIIYIKQEVMQ